MPKRDSLILGATGSGKSNFGGRIIAAALSQEGSVLPCVKPEEGDLWESLLAKFGRQEDAIGFRIKDAMTGAAMVGSVGAGKTSGKHNGRRRNAKQKPEVTGNA